MLDAWGHHLPLGPHPIHVRPVGHDLAVHLLVLGVLDEFLVFPGAALADAAEGEDDDGQSNYAAHDADDDVLGGLGEAVPFLRHGLGAGGTVFAVEGEGLGVAVERVLVRLRGDWGGKWLT